MKYGHTTVCLTLRLLKYGLLLLDRPFQPLFFSNIPLVPLSFSSSFGTPMVTNVLVFWPFCYCLLDFLLLSQRSLSLFSFSVSEWVNAVVLSPGTLILSYHLHSLRESSPIVTFISAVVSFSSLISFCSLFITYISLLIFSILFVCLFQEDLQLLREAFL